MPSNQSSSNEPKIDRLAMIRNAAKGIRSQPVQTDEEVEHTTQVSAPITTTGRTDHEVKTAQAISPERPRDEYINQQNIAGSLFEGLLKKQRELASTRWSVAELKISFPELEKLVEWIKSPSQFEINEAFERGWSKALDPSGQYTNEVVAGLILHVIAAETVRRFGTEGSYWSCVYKQLPWGESSRSQLFLNNGQPSAFHKKLLEKSAQALEMRHTFDIDGVQQYFSTGFLQFGFTHFGFKKRLGEWLAGYHISTNAIEALTHDSNLHSNSFGKLWEDLSRYRNNQLTDQQLENRIKESCWILPEWISDLKVAAKEKLHLGTQSRNRGDGEFLSLPMLEFNNSGHPEFKFRLKDLIDLPLTGESYTVTLDDERKLDLIRQNDGGYDPVGSEEFIVSWEKYRLQAAVKDCRTGAQAAAQDVNIWQPDEFLHVFAENGRKYTDAFALKGQPGNAIHIMFPCLLSHEIQGDANSIWTSAENTWKIVTLSPEADFKLLLDDEVFWELQRALKPTRELIDGRNFIAEALSINASPVDIQSWPLRSTLELSTHESAPINIKWARIGFEKFNFDAGTQSAILKVLPEYLERGVSIQFSVEAFGQKLLIRKRALIPYTGAFWIRDNGVKYQVPRVLHTQDASRIKLCAFPKSATENDDTSSYCITEGYHFTRRLAKNAIQLSGLAGFGSPLILQKGLFNQWDTPQILADAVIDGGCIHQVKISEDYLTIFPSNFVNLKNDFVAIAWVGGEGNMRLERLTLSEGPASDLGDQVWCARNNSANECINAIGIFYEGECIGSWWNLSSWTRALTDCQSREQAEEYSKVIRLFNCPILYEENRRFMTSFLQRFPAETLLTWLQANVHLSFDKDTKLSTTPKKYNTWLRAIGILFEDATPTMDLADISLLIEQLTTRSKDPISLDSLAKVTHLLTAASPVLAASVISPWLDDYARHEDAAKANQARLGLINELTPSEEELEDISANLIRADSHFIQEHCSDFGKNGFHLPSARKDNLPYLFEYSITRRIAAAQHFQHHPISKT